jgi:hypothetical protein
MTCLSDIIAALPTLSASERKQVRFMLETLDKGVSYDTNSPEALLWEAIVKVSDERGVTVPSYIALMSRNSKKNGSTIPNFSKDSASIKLYIDKHLRPPDRTAEIHCYRLCARALVSYLSEAMVPISASSLARNLQNIPAAIDKFWPGYVKSGAIKMILYPRGNTS